MLQVVRECLRCRYAGIYYQNLPRICGIVLHLDNSIIVDVTRVALSVVGVEKTKVVVLVLVGDQVHELPPQHRFLPGKVHPSWHIKHCWIVFSLNIIYFVIEYIPRTITLKSIM